MARKWIDEKILQKYFVENCTEYSIIVNGIEYPITSARFNEPFDRFPDLFCTVNGEEYPVEVEWLSSQYDHHEKNKERTSTKPYTHKMFMDNNGFLVVLEKDCEVSNFRQVILDNEKLKRWFKKKAVHLLNESIDQFSIERRKKRKYPKIWFIYVSEAVIANWKHSKSMGVWGFTSGRLQQNKDIKDVQDNDIVIFFGPVETGKIKLRGWPRISDEALKTISKADDYIIQDIEIFRVTKSYYDERDRASYSPIWPDEDEVNQKYPNRFMFETDCISKFSDVPFNKINFFTLKRLKEAIMASPIEIDYSNFVELLRNYKS